MIESNKVKRYKVCFRHQVGDKLIKKFIVLKSKSASDIKAKIEEEYGEMDYYDPYDHYQDTRVFTEPGIHYIRAIRKIRAGDVTKD